MCSRWLVGQGARPVATDLSSGMLAQGRASAERTEIDVPLVQADAEHLPFADRSFDIAFTAFGAVPFVADSARVMGEVARVLVPGGRWVFSTTHPMRWCFPYDPGPDGLTARMPYWDRTPYVEFDDRGAPTYVEHHRTFGDRVREIVAAGFRLVDVVEPEWPESNPQVWGGWSPLRGAAGSPGRPSSSPSRSRMPPGSTRPRRQSDLWPPRRRVGRMLPDQLQRRRSTEARPAQAEQGQRRCAPADVAATLPGSPWPA